MNVVIIGGGSTGLVYGSRLSEITDVNILVRRREAKEAINEEGVTFELHGGGNEQYKPHATTDPAVLLKAELVISLTKCNDVLSVAETLKRNLSPQAIVLPLHNGIGTQDIYRAVVPKDNLLLGLQYLAANRLNDTTVSLGPYSKTIFGEDNGSPTDRIYRIAELTSKAGFETYTPDDVNKAVWEKLRFACCQHALSAIYNMTFGEMRDDENVVNRQKILNDEFLRVARAEGIDFGEGDSFNLVLENMAKGSQHKSSLCQDVLAGRKTEIDFINGAISRLGNQHGIDTEENDKIVAEIKKLESQ
jgi:2-dehydropantoate 2-reductase